MRRQATDYDRLRAAIVTTELVRAATIGDWLLFGSLRQFLETRPYYADWRHCERDAALHPDRRFALRQSLARSGFLDF